MSLAFPSASSSLLKKKLFRLKEDNAHVRRVQVTLGGRIMLENHEEYSATISETSVYTFKITSQAPVHRGERIIGYFFTLGRVEGLVVDMGDDYFVMSLVTTAIKRDKLAGQLIWLANRAVLGLPEDRRYDRIVPNRPQVILRRIDDPTRMPIQAIFIDLSKSGAALSVVEKFSSGEEIMVGRKRARVMRVFEKGVGVEFNERILDSIFNSSIEI